MGADVTPYNIRYTMILTDFLVGIGDMSVIVKQLKNIMFKCIIYMVVLIVNN